MEAPKGVGGELGVKRRREKKKRNNVECPQILYFVNFVEIMTTTLAKYKPGVWDMDLIVSLSAQFSSNLINSSILNNTHFRYPIYDLAKNSIPRFWPLQLKQLP